MCNELQKNESYLPGNLGAVVIASSGKVSDITEILANKDGSVTLTLMPQTVHEVAGTEDAEFEIIDPKTAVFDIKRIDDRLRELGALEDVNCEIIQPKQLT